MACFSGKSIRYSSNTKQPNTLRDKGTNKMPQILVTTPLDEMMEGEESLLRFYIYKSNLSIEEIHPLRRERMHPFQWDSMTNEEHIEMLKRNLDYLDDLRIDISDITTISPNINADISIYKKDIGIRLILVDPDDLDKFNEPRYIGSKSIDLSMKENGEVVLVIFDDTKTPGTREIHYKTTLFEGK